MFGNMQGRIGFLLIPFLCSSCNIIPRTQFVNPDFPISQFLHIFSTLPYIPSVSGVLCGSDCAVQQSQSSHNDHRARSHLSSIPCPCRADGLTAGLCSFLDFADHISVQCRDTRFAAKDCRCVWNLNRRVDVHSAPFKTFLFFYIDASKADRRGGRLILYGLCRADGCSFRSRYRPGF